MLSNRVRNLLSHARFVATHILSEVIKAKFILSKLKTNQITIYDARVNAWNLEYTVYVIFFIIFRNEGKQLMEKYTK